jgi:serine/threonine protein kinase
MNFCTSLDDLERLLDERLDDLQRISVEDHVEGCLTCQQRLEEISCARNETRARAVLAPGNDASGPEASFLRAFKEHGPPRWQKGGDTGSGVPHLTEYGPSCSNDSEPPGQRHRLPTIAGFEIVREIGQGGMGVVYEATELSLGRRAALKVLTAPRATTIAVERFRREARAAAKLHHTNIVPVFGVGEDDGQLFYVMQFIDGESLSQVFNRLATRQTATDATKMSSRLSEVSGPAHFRAIAGIGQKVAEALAYAHNQGILHRDIKPANLLLDARGSVWITDFGLAKSFEGEDGLTRTGDIVGTIRYMAPERFEGHSEPRSDVYALGVTLYELLTLRPLFAESSHAKLIERVVHDEPIAPRRIDRRIPHDLETIVRKAMAKEPEARYASAEALTDDLRRFLQGVPVLARPVGPAARLARWCRRQPKLAAAISLSTASLILATGLSIALAFSQYRASARLRAERSLTLGEKTRAEESFRDAQQAVEDYLTRVSNDTLLKQEDSGEFRQLRKDLLEDALKYYQRFLVRRGNDPGLLADLAHARSAVAGIIGEIGSAAESVNQYHHAVSIWEKLVHENPADGDASAELARCLYNLADRQATIGLHDESLHSFELAVAILAPLARAKGADSDTRHLLGLTLTYHGLEQERAGQPLAAIQSIQEALSIFEALIRDNPTDAHPQPTFNIDYRGRPKLARWQLDLAFAYRGLGFTLLSLDRSAEALHYLEQSVPLCRALVRNYPTVIVYQRRLAENLSKIGRVLTETSQTAAALQSYQEALEVLDTKPRPANGDRYAQADRVEILNGIGASAAKLHRTDDAIRAFEQAHDMTQELVRNYPGEAWFRQNLVIGNKGLAGLYRKVGRWKETLSLLSVGQAILEAHPEDWTRYQYHLACYLSLRVPPASAGLSQQNLEEGRRYGDQAIVSLRRSAAREFKSLEFFRSDPNLDPLRNRADFQTLLMDLAFPVDPFTR